MEEKTLEPGAEARRRPQRAGGGGPSQDRETGAADTAYANSQPTPTRSLCEPNPPRPVSSEDPFSPGYTHSIMEPAPKKPVSPRPLADIVSYIEVIEGRKGRPFGRTRAFVWVQFER